MEFSFKNGGTWYWLRNDKQRMIWRLCAIRLDVFPNEIVEKIADYFYDATYLHRPCDECMKNAKWLPIIRQNNSFKNEWECNVKSQDCKHPMPLEYPLREMYISYINKP